MITKDGLANGWRVEVWAFTFRGWAVVEEYSTEQQAEALERYARAEATGERVRLIRVTEQVWRHSDKPDEPCPDTLRSGEDA